MFLSPSPLLSLILSSTLLWLSLPSALCYERPSARGIADIPPPAPADMPEQVHISMVGANSIRICWVTASDASSVVDYGTSPGFYTSSAVGSSSTYEFGSYTSGLIHNVDIGPLIENTVYYYRCSNAPKEFILKTPPAQFPINFVVVGDLGQTKWTQSTLDHIAVSGYDVLLLPGDLSYADEDQSQWDTFGRLMEQQASQRPWMVAHGNHEIESRGGIEDFRAYNARWRMPYELSGSSTNLYYSFDAAGGAVHVVMLGSFTDFSIGSAQYNWLVEDLGKIDRQATPWVVALIHAPWYNSNHVHQGDGEKMRIAMEILLYIARVDVVFAGHVHAYERFGRVYMKNSSACGPVHIVVGDGGNREGLASSYIYPMPAISLFREASFGHGQFYVVNATHAVWSWHRNEDDAAVVGDSVWLTSVSAHPECAPA